MITRNETLPILYRDEHLVAVHKPAGLLVHRTVLDAHERRFALQLLRRQLRQRVYPVHRIDKGTSGVLLFALSREVARILGDSFARHAVAKTYVAIVRGHPPQDGEIDYPLRRPLEAMANLQPYPDVRATPLQDAVTRFRRLATIEVPHRVDRYPSSRYALMEIQPISGRYHQIRRHFKHVSHPLIGDATYGKGRHNRLFQDLFGCHRLLLACVELRILHPISGEPLVIGAPLAADFTAVLHALDWVASVPPQWLVAHPSDLAFDQ